MFARVGFCGARCGCGGLVDTSVPWSVSQDMLVELIVELGCWRKRRVCVNASCDLCVVREIGSERVFQFHGLFRLCDV